MAARKKNLTVTAAADESTDTGTRLDSLEARVAALELANDPIASQAADCAKLGLVPPVEGA